MADELKKLLPADFEQGVADMQAMGPPRAGWPGGAAFHEGFRPQAQRGVHRFRRSRAHDAGRAARPGPAGQQAQRFDAVFVDEYQDVSALQEAILNALKRAR